MRSCDEIQIEKCAHLQTIYNHVWFWRSRLPERKGQRCHVFARGGRNSIGAEFEDGFRVITFRYAVRRASPAKRQH